MVLRDGAQRKFLIGIRVQGQYFIGVSVLSQNFRASCVLRDPYFTPSLTWTSIQNVINVKTSYNAIALLKKTLQRPITP